MGFILHQSGHGHSHGGLSGGYVLFILVIFGASTDLMFFAVWNRMDTTRRMENTKRWSVTITIITLTAITIITLTEIMMTTTTMITTTTTMITMITTMAMELSLIHI